MKKLFVTFGQIHVHKVGGIVFDKDCVAVVYGETYQAADDLAFKLFHGKFHAHEPETSWDDEKMKYFPRGYIDVNPPYERPY